MPNILMIYDVGYPFVEGGGQRRMHEVACRLIQRGYSIDWLCFKTWDGDNVVIGSSGIRYIGMDGYRGLYRKDGSRRRMEPIEFLFAFLGSDIKFGKYDFVWSGQWPMVHLLWFLIFSSKLVAAKLVVDWWEIWGDTWFKYSRALGLIGFFLEKQLLTRLSKFACIILISPDSHRTALNISPDGKFKLIHNGIDLNLIRGVSGVEVPVFDVVYLGRLKDHKRVDILIKAISLIGEIYGYKATALIVGDGPEYSRLVEMTNELNLSDQIKFSGSVSSNADAYKMLSSARIFVNPSTKEGGGSITLFEAFAVGLPVVAFRCKDGIDPELVGDGVSGKLINTVSPASLCDGLYELLVDPMQVAFLRKGALESAEKYDWRVIAEDYISVFE